MKCVECSSENPPHSSFCVMCGRNLTETGRVIGRGEKTPAVAVLLSMFLPAVGQIYNGELKKAVVFWAGYLLGLVLSGVLIGTLILFGVWLWSMFDAYKTASLDSMGVARSR